MVNQGVYGEYNVEVVRSGDNGSYYPFGTGYRKNVILDEFLGKIFSGYNHTPQAWMQTCITNTGTGIATRFDTTGTFGVPNDVTWASTQWNYAIYQSINTVQMNRDFIFNAPTSTKTYREAMVGFFYTNQTNQAGVIYGDIALSHFVFPYDVTIYPGDRLKINYTLNLVLEHLNTGLPIQLSDSKYNFGGRIRLGSDAVGIFGAFGGNNTYINARNGYYWGFCSLSTCSNNTYYITRNFTVNSPTFTITQGGTPAYNNIFGGFLNYQSNGYYSTEISTYPNRYTGINIFGPAATIYRDNFVINESGASIDCNYYLPPVAYSRFCSGITLTRHPVSGESAGTERGIGTLASYSNNIIFTSTHLAFNTPQNILANDAVSMKLRWYINRL